MSPMRELLALPAGSTVKPEHLLGFLTMFTVPDRGVPHRDVVRLWISEGLDPDAMPNESKPIDAFQQACAAVRTRRNKTADRDVEILAEQMMLGGGECLYKITRSVKDRQGRDIDHRSALRVEFSSVSGEIKVIHDRDYRPVQELEGKIRANYKRFLKTVPGAKIRGAVRETVVDALGGTDYMGKGAYMVPSEGLRTLESLRTILTTLYEGEARLVLIPLLNTKDSRDDLATFHADDMQNRVGSLMEKVADKLTAGGTVRKDMLSNVIQERLALREQRDRMLNLIGKKTGRVDESLKLLDEQMEELMSLATEGRRAA